jgi:hypothetical protein
LRLLVHSSGQAFCWLASNQNAAPLPDVPRHTAKFAVPR